MQKNIIRREIQIQSDLLLDPHPILQRIYANRGISHSDEVKKTLDHLLPFENLLGIDKATQLLGDAIKNNESILVIGDFDADGATSCALAVKALQALGAKQVGYLVPNRFEYGYGLTPEIVEVALIRSPQLIVTVDNGISSHAGVAFAKEHGIKVIITDHHLPAETLPAADAIVNPNQLGCPFSSKNLAGVGVIFYVMTALRSYLRQQNWFTKIGIPEPKMTQFLDLVALGTVTDVVPLDKNNRILVYHGLQRIQAGLCCFGIQALFETAKRQLAKVDAMDLGFVVGPRLNAAGRLDDMSIGIECLLADELIKARELAQILNDMNQERRFIERDMQKQALGILENLRLHHKDVHTFPLGLCLYDERWHQGVIGILAGRIKDKWHRPVIVFAPINEHEMKGSARSIPGLHIRDVLSAVAVHYPDILNKFGGHAMAAGLSLKKEDYSLFCKAFNEELGRQLNPESLKQIIYTDGQLPATMMGTSLVELLQQAGPWGQNFPEPLFDDNFLILDQRLIADKHLKLLLRTENYPEALDAIYFNVDTHLWPNHRCKKVHAAFRPDINEYQGSRRLQLIVEHLIEI